MPHRSPRLAPPLAYDSAEVPPVLSPAPPPGLGRPPEAVWTCPGCGAGEPCTPSVTAWLAAKGLVCGGCHRRLQREAAGRA